MSGSQSIASNGSGPESDPLALKITNNLSDLTNVSTARANLELGTAATKDSTAFTTLSINNQLDNYILALSDAGKYVRMNKVSAISLTIPPNSSVAFIIGTEIAVRQVGAGVLTFVAGLGVIINSSGLSSYGQHSGFSLVKIDTDEWDLTGGLT